jgi:hypothetical protein
MPRRCAPRSWRGGHAGGARADRRAVFWQPKGRSVVDGQRRAVDTLEYHEFEVRRIVQMAFELARGRRGKVTSVDKANVLESSRLWRQVTEEVHRDYPDVILEHMLVDTAAMRLISYPAGFDVLVTENMFGDILTDEAAVLSGSMGVLPSASLGSDGPRPVRADSRLCPRYCRARHRQPDRNRAQRGFPAALFTWFGARSAHHRTGGRSHHCARCWTPDLGGSPPQRSHSGDYRQSKQYFIIFHGYWQLAPPGLKCWPSQYARTVN